AAVAVPAAASPDHLSPAQRLEVERLVSQRVDEELRWLRANLPELVASAVAAPVAASSDPTEMASTTHKTAAATETEGTGETTSPETAARIEAPAAAETTAPAEASAAAAPALEPAPVVSLATPGTVADDVQMD
ncbi:MAG: hypothetical protein M3Y54_15995, partial [Bacteroidota bacterium]|nr:hypothetical protein [Bacteroidota bacterium]